MKSFLYAITALAVVGLAFWAYRENYATQHALAEQEAMHAQIRHANERLAMLNAEWAYLNRPDRLRHLVEMNEKRLQLFPLSAAQFGSVAEIVRPGTKALVIENAVDVSALSLGERP